MTTPDSSQQSAHDQSLPEEVYWRLVDNSELGIVVDQDGKIVRANAAFAAMFGYAPEEMQGRPIESLVAPEDLQTVLENVRKRLSGETTAVQYRARVVRSDGTVFTVHASGARIIYQGRPAIQSVLYDLDAAAARRQALARQNERLEALGGIGVRLAAELDRAELLDSICREALALVGAQGGGICLPDPNTNLLVSVAGAGHGHEFFSGLTFEPGKGGIGRAFSRGETVVVNSARDDPRSNKRLAAAADIRSFVHIPIRLQDQSLGVLTVNNKRNGDFDEDDVDLLTAIAGQAAVAIRNADIYETTRRARDREMTISRLLTQIKTCLHPEDLPDVTISELGRLLGASRCFFCRHHDQRIIITHKWLAPGAPDVPRVDFTPDDSPDVHNDLLSGAVVVLDSTDPRSSESAKMLMREFGTISGIAVPIMARQQLLGWLVADHTDRHRQWTDADKQLVVAIGQHLGVAMDNGSMLQALRDATRREDLINSLLKRIKISLDPDQAIALAVAELGQLLGASRCIFAETRGDGYVTTSTWTASDAPAAVYARQSWGDLPELHSKLRAGQLLVLDDDEESPETALLKRKFGVLSSIAAPVMVSEALAGILAIDQCDRPRRWTQADIDLVRDIADHLGVALSNADWYQALRESRDREMLLARLVQGITPSLELDEIADSALSQLGHVMGASRALYCTVFGDGWRVEHEWAAPGIPRHPEGVGRWADIPGIRDRLAENETIAINDVAADAPDVLREGMLALNTKSAIVSPVFVGGEIFGLLVLHQCDRPRTWTRREIDLLRGLASYLGLVLHNADMYDQLRDASEQLALTNAQLRDMTNDLARANLLKSEFLAKTSHELRTPINSILGFLQMLLSGHVVDLDDQRQFLRDVRVSARDMLNLLNDLLDIGRIETGTFRLELAPVRLQKVFRQVRALTALEACNKGLTLDFELPQPLTVMADRRRLRQVLLNLLSNSLKFTPKGGIVVRGVLAAAPGFAEISVTDTGIGVPRSKQDRMFHEFYAEPSNHGRFGGTGLGLAISRSLVELMGGRISLESKGQNKGTTVTFTVPLAEEC